MTKKHILIVDDAKDILFLLQLSLKKLGSDFKVSTAMDGPSALEKIRQEKFDLVLADYMMPGMTGMDLAQQVQQISPDTRLILMTAYDTPLLREQVQLMALSGFVSKPFTVPQVMKVINQVLAKTPEELSPEQNSHLDSNISQTIFDALRTLYNKIGARYVVLLDYAGQPIKWVGQVDQKNLSRLATFVASNFRSMTELAGSLGENSHNFKSSYFEGVDYHIYAYEINPDFLLAVVFSISEKPGTVWLYTRQTAETLQIILERVSKSSMINDNTTVASEFDSLLGSEPV